MYDKIEILTPTIFPKHAILAGVTKKNNLLFPPLGLSVSKGDILTDEEVNLHRLCLAKEIGLTLNEMKFQKQIHSDLIQIVGKNTPNGLETDGMLTKEQNITLNISIADCTGILMYDPIKKTIAGVHSGWKGTKLNIIAKAILKLKQEYSTKPSDLLVYLSPSASGYNYEVEWDVARYFPDSIKQLNGKKYLYDNKKQIKIQLLECGVLENNIEISDICTIESKDYHSFRRDKHNSGRMSCFIAMK